MSKMMADDPLGSMDEMLQRLREAELALDPEWMVPMLFRAPDLATAKKITETMSIVIKSEMYKLPFFESNSIPKPFALFRIFLPDGKIEVVSDEEYQVAEGLT